MIYKIITAAGVPIKLKQTIIASYLALIPCRLGQSQVWPSRLGYPN